MLRQSSSPLVRAATTAAAASTTAAAARPTLVAASLLRATTGVQTRFAHRRVPLPYDAEHGLPGFLSPNALRTVAVDWQQGVLARLDELVRGQSRSLSPTCARTQALIKTPPRRRHRSREQERAADVEGIGAGSDPDARLQLCFRSPQQLVLPLDPREYHKDMITRLSTDLCPYRLPVSHRLFLLLGPDSVLVLLDKVVPNPLARFLPRPRLSLFRPRLGLAPFFGRLRLARDRPEREPRRRRDLCRRDGPRQGARANWVWLVCG